MAPLTARSALWALGAAAATLLQPARAAAVTQPSAYAFNHVAITGGGFITGIIAHPTEADLLYVRTDIGGAYRWNKPLNKWIPLTDFLGTADANFLGTDAIGLDPTDPNRLYLANGRYQSTNTGQMFVSSDRGSSFQRYDTPFPMGSNDMGRNMGERLAVNPFAPNELYMGTRTAGLFRSTDRGQTWKNVTSFPNAFANSIGIVCVLFDANKSGTIYAAAHVPQGLYVSHDAGATWSAVAGQPADWSSVTLYAGNTPQSTGPQPSKMVLGSNGILYVTYTDAPGPWGVDYGTVYKYNTATGVWTNIAPNANNTTPAPFTPQAWPPGGYCGLSIDPKKPDTVLLVSLDRDPGPALDSMYLSRDGGKTWKDVSQLSTPPGSGGYWGHPIAQAALANGTKVPWLSFDWSPEWGGYGAPSPVYGLAKFGWWMTAALIDPSNPDHVMYGTGATIWSTDKISAADTGKTVSWYVQAQGIEETVALAMISPAGGAHLLSGLGDINGMVHTDLDVPQPMYDQPTFSNCDTLDWAGQKPLTVVRAGSSGLNDTNGCAQGAYATDGGTGNWTKFQNCVPGIAQGNWNGGKITIDASGKVVVWAALTGDGGPQSSSNWGQTWTAPTGLTTQTSNIAADRVQAKTFYALVAGTWYLSTDGGLSYSASSVAKIGLPNNASATPVPSFAKAGEVWVAGSDGVYYTTTFGASWTKLGGCAKLNATYFSIGAPAQGASTPALYLWGTAGSAAKHLNEDGLYRSDDNGASWVRVNDDSHQYGGPMMIQGDPRVYGRVFIGTGGRGIIRADIARGAQNVPGTGGI